MFYSAVRQHLPLHQSLQLLREVLPVFHGLHQQIPGMQVGLYLGAKLLYDSVCHTFSLNIFTRGLTTVFSYSIQNNGYSTIFLYLKRIKYVHVWCIISLYSFGQSVTGIAWLICWLITHKPKYIEYKYKYNDDNTSPVLLEGKGTDWVNNMVHH